jgi:hypothetical protein
VEGVFETLKRDFGWTRRRYARFAQNVADAVRMATVFNLRRRPHGLDLGRRTPETQTNLAHKPSARSRRPIFPLPREGPRPIAHSNPISQRSPMGLDWKSPPMSSRGSSGDAARSKALVARHLDDVAEMKSPWFGSSPKNPRALPVGVSVSGMFDPQSASGHNRYVASRGSCGIG